MSSNWNRTVIGLELQIPYHNPKIFEQFIRFLIIYQPTRVVGIGDHLDCPAPSRWSRGTAEEYAGKLQKEIDTLKKFFERIREVYDGTWEVHRGNHERRIDTYAKTKAPAFASLDCLSIPELLGYDDYSIRELPDVAPLCRGWVTTHDFGGLLRVSSKYAGGSAISGAIRLGKSVVMGHTHKLGHIQQTIGGRTLHGVETGHMMDEKKASYIMAPNWQSGWVVVESHNDKDVVGVQLVNCNRKGQWT